MAQQRKRKPRRTGRFLNILLLVFAFLVVFEGRLIINIASRGGIHNQVQEQLDEIFSSKDFQQDEASAESETSSEATKDSTTVPKNITPFAQDSTTSAINAKCIVKEQATAVDDSYFSDAVFIGDSRVEGFHMQSGITQGTFLTGIGMNSSDISETAYITTSSGNVTVFQALKNNSFKKMYIMLGTNDLGYPDFEEFRKNYTSCLAELRKLMPDAIFYVSAVPYVEEAKVQTILEYLKTGDVFGSALSALSPDGDSLQVICTKSCKIQFIDYAHLIKRCPNACNFHSLLVSNALQLISRKAIALSEHLEILSQRTTKEKLLCYFEKLAQEQHSNSFTLPFSLSTLADYLSVDRSAMMRELKKLKADGIIKSDRKTFTLVEYPKN